jgi:hypothetical protein
LGSRALRNGHIDVMLATQPRIGEETMNDRIAKTLTDPTATRRVVVLEIRGGLFRWKEEELIPADPENGFPLPEWRGWRVSGLFALGQEAEHEARMTVAWLREAG